MHLDKDNFYKLKQLQIVNWQILHVKDIMDTIIQQTGIRIHFLCILQYADSYLDPAAHHFLSFSLSCIYKCTCIVVADHPNHLTIPTMASTADKRTPPPGAVARLVWTQVRCPQARMAVQARYQMLDGRYLQCICKIYTRYLQ